jgi:hypothetical protein
VTVPFPKKEVRQLWTGFFIMPYTEKLDNLHGRPTVNVVSGETFYIHDKNSSTLSKPLGWLSLKTMEDEINHLLSRADAKFCTPNGSTCTGKTIGLLVRRHIVAGEFHYIGKEASTRWSSGLDLSMMAEAGALDPTHETFRECERVVYAKYLDEIRAQVEQFSTKLLSRQSRVAECAIRSFKNGKNTIKLRTLRKLTRAIHDLQKQELRRSLAHKWTARNLGSLSHMLSELGVMESKPSCGRLALVSICITARQPQGYRITFQLRALAGFRLRSARLNGTLHPVRCSPWPTNGLRATRQWSG